MSTPFLVKDIYPGSFGSYLGFVTALGNTLFFWANDGVNGYGLWKSDGTTAGTVLVADISFGDSFPGNLTAVGNTLFFQAYDGVNGGELWKSDGTAAGTVLVKDIRPGLSTSYPGNLTAVGNTLFFTADDGVNGTELWKSDGTAAGTVLVKDIRPGYSGFGPRYLTVVGNTLFFWANDGVNGYGLWKSDGTTAGTVLVADISFGDSFPGYLTVVGSTLFFSAYDGVNGTELWQSDGTAAGTVLVGDIRPGSYGSYPFSLTAVGNTLFFQAYDGVNGQELWALNVGGPTVPTLAIAATSASQTEGNSGSKAFTFTVTRGDNTTGSNNVDWAVTGSGSNPANATDFAGGLLPSGVVSFAPGESSKVITVDVQGDTTVELNENFTVTLSNATNGATITTATATGTIQNDDVAIPTLAIAATNANQTEGNSGSKAFTFTVTRAVNTTGSNNVNWAVTGSGSNPANATDFVGGVLPSGTVSFATGETSQVITVDVQGDTTVELNENFTVTLSNPTNGANITTATATGTINNDDFIGTSGPDTLAGTSGADALTGLAGNDTYTVNDAGDLVIEALNQGTDTVQASIFYTLPNNVENLLLTGTGNLNGTGNGLNNQITGNSGNNNLNGAAGNDSLNGAAGNDTLNGAAGRDTLTGGTGTDIFIFRFGQSTSAALDRVTDFAIGTDKIDLLSQAGGAINAPLAFTRAANSTTTNINTIVTNVFTDANGATAGNQALGINSAVLVRDNSSSTYLIINDGTLGFQSANDLVINLTGLTGTLPALGTIAVNSFFV
ncbi:MAG: hyalin [Microcystis aeruginosa LG11-05]|nr:hyalin [Microcystis aeruginosa LG11-05]